MRAAKFAARIFNCPAYMPETTQKTAAVFCARRVKFFSFAHARNFEYLLTGKRADGIMNIYVEYINTCG